MSSAFPLSVTPPQALQPVADLRRTAVSWPPRAAVRLQFVDDPSRRSAVKVGGLEEPRRRRRLQPRPDQQALTYEGMLDRLLKFLAAPVHGRSLGASAAAANRTASANIL